jgi:hypothetical protein
VAQQLFDISPGMPPPDKRYVLGAIPVHTDVAEKLAKVTHATGATAAWHRRRALAVYLDSFNDEGEPRSRAMGGRS